MNDEWNIDSIITNQDADNLTNSNEMYVEIFMENNTESVEPNNSEDVHTDEYADESVVTNDEELFENANNIVEDVLEEIIDVTETEEEPDQNQMDVPDVSDYISQEEYTAVVEELEFNKQRNEKLLADWDNYKRRTAEEIEVAKKNANANIMKSMLPIFDDFDRMLLHYRNNDSLNQEIVQGVNNIYKKLFDALEKEGLTRISPKGQPFDMNKHQAISRCNDPELAPDTVAEVLQDGYELNGVLIRPAMVSVVVE